MKCLTDNCNEEMMVLETGKVFGLEEENNIPEIIIPFSVSIHYCTKCNHSFIIPKDLPKIITPEEPKIIIP